LVSSNASPLAVDLDGVRKRYGGLAAVDGVSLAVAQGQTVALVGPSGAGKTTLLRLMAGSLAPDDGVVRLHGRNIGALTPGRELAGLVGIVAQQYDLVPNLSALQNVLAGHLGSWSLWRSLLSLVAPRDKLLAMRALERFGVADQAYQRAGLLSGGEQQRVAIARVLVQDPAVVLADEPVASLDPARAADVLQLLTGIARDNGKTLMASMHAVELAMGHFDRLVGVRDGTVRFDAAPSAVTEAMLVNLYALDVEIA
jgi:phosphonate transport system ATP-binding protein